jgi:catechol 2,3-dioxygenase-like lactoylglutathione lyase family enzyme
MSARPPSPSLTGIDHIALKVRDLDRSIDFYTAALGLKLERRRSEIGLAHLRAGDALVDLIGLGSNTKPGLDHFCLRVGDLPIDGIVRHLTALDICIDRPALRYGATGDGMSIYLRDPDGHGLELRSHAPQH